MAPLVLLAYASLGSLAGLAIGCVGIGGVIIVPALVLLAGQSLPTAIAAAMFAFFISGIVGVHVYSKSGSIDWRMAAWTWVGALPCAFAGALLIDNVAPAFLELAIGALTAGSGLYALVTGRRNRPRPAKPLSGARLAAIGAVTGFISALTGTGGPVVIIPILVWLDIPLLAAIGLAQAVQLPIAAAATGGTLLEGALDVRLGLTLACGIALGTWAGAKAAHALPTATLRKIVAALLVAVGIAMLVRVA